MADVSFSLDVPSTGAGDPEDISTAGAEEKTFTWTGASSDSILTVETSADGETGWARLVKLEGDSGALTMDLVSDWVRLVRYRGTGGTVDVSGQTLPVGATGPTGSTGATGPTGATGAAGTNGTNGATGATGATGVAGADGNSFRSGSGAPSSGVGINGDFWLDTGSGNLYQKATGSWSLIGSIIGPTGPAGPTVLEFVQPADVSGTLGQAETAVARPGSTVTVSHFRVIPNGAVAGSGMNYASIILSKRSAAGSQTVLATITSVAGWTMWTEVVQAFTGTSIGATDVLTIEITKSGTGVLLPSFLVVID